MKYKFSNIVNTIKSLLEIRKKINEITEERENQFLNSEYYKASKLILDKLSYGDINIREKTYDELLSMIDTEAKKRIKSNWEDSDSYFLKWEELYFKEENKEIRKSYPNFEELKKSLLEEQKQINSKINSKIEQNLNNLVNEFKNLKDAFDYINTKLRLFDEQKEKLIEEEKVLLEMIPINSNIELLGKGIEYNEFGFPIIKDDMELVFKNPKFDSSIALDDLIMVHATNYFPQNGIIASSRNAIGSKRNTVHFSLNGRVSSHESGDWDDCSLVIIDPLKYHIDQVECLYSVDTFTYGSVKLSPNAIILIDNNKFKQFYDENKKYIEKNRDRIILFSGDSLIVVNRLLGLFGYVPEKMTKWCWLNKKDDALLNNFISKNYPNIISSAHSSTPYEYLEQNRTRDEVLKSLGIVDDGNDMIISLDVLYALYEHNKLMSIEQFIKYIGVFVMDNEIHLLGIKDHLSLLQQKEISNFQIEKVGMLIEKYKLMKMKKLDLNNNEIRQV